MLCWFKRRTAAPQPRADRTMIAILEYELFGIDPEPNTAAALTIELRRAFGGGAQRTPPPP